MGVAGISPVRAFGPRLMDRTAIVTGGGQGLGQALSWRLAREGAHVLIADVNFRTAQETATAIMAETSRNIIPLEVNVTDEEQVSGMVNRANAEFGHLDIAVSNAGILHAGKTVDFDLAKWNQVLAVNITGYFLFAKHAARVMMGQENGGSIIQINSKSGKKGSKANAAYATSKFAGIGLTQSLALEFAAQNIRVNAICPGNLLDSPLWNDPERGLFRQYLDAGKVPGATSLDDVRKFYMGQVPLHRGCEYEDIGNLMVFLASDESSYMTGQAINVTGGQEMH